MWKLFDNRRRPEAVLDIYNLLLGALLFASPWLFAFPHGTAGAKGTGRPFNVAIAERRVGRGISL